MISKNFLWNKGKWSGSSISKYSFFVVSTMSIFIILVALTGPITASQEDIRPKTIRIIQSPHYPEITPNRFCNNAELVVDGIMAEQALTSENGILSTIPKCSRTQLRAAILFNNPNTQPMMPPIHISEKIQAKP